MVDLAMVLSARDRRHDLRIERLKHGLCCVTLMMNVPGRKKNSLTIMRGFHELYNYVHQILTLHMTIVESASKEYVTGPEGYFIVKADPRDLKVLMMSIENAHPLGRLADLDVYDERNTPMKRVDYGESSRRCLVCEEDAKICARRKSHSPQLILAVIECRITKYFKESHREIIL